jgi:hypothetical protein
LSLTSLLEIIRRMPDIEISMGENSRDHIFRLKKGQQLGEREQNSTL